MKDRSTIRISTYCEDGLIEAVLYDIKKDKVKDV
jgi:hypothetical protein